MSRVPPETPSWDESKDPETAARDLREQLAHAKARMQEHRDQMLAAGLTTKHDHDTKGA
jgi:hypothetical protein